MIQVYICILRATQLQMLLGVRDIQSWIGDGLRDLSSQVILSSALAIRDAGKRNT